MLLFRGIHGCLDLDLSRKGKDKAGTVLPTFYSRAGEEVEIPKRFRQSVRAITGAVHCDGCFHCHYVTPPEKNVTSPIVLPNRKDSFAEEAFGARETGDETDHRTLRGIQESRQKYLQEIEKPGIE